MIVWRDGMPKITLSIAYWIGLTAYEHEPVYPHSSEGKDERDFRKMKYENTIHI